MFSKLRLFFIYVIVAGLVMSFLRALYEGDAPNLSEKPSADSLSKDPAPAKALPAASTSAQLPITQYPGAVYPTFPVAGHHLENIISGYYDRRGTRIHHALDIKAPRGTAAIAVVQGRVSQVSEHNLAGNFVILHDSSRNLFLYYAHLDECLVQVGDLVQEGMLIGRVGDTGNATTPHLHFAIQKPDRSPLNPLDFLKSQ